MATDLWLGKSVLRRDDPFHPLGLRHDTTDEEGTTPPPYDDVLAARADRVALVRDYLATVTDEALDEEVQHPHEPQRQVTARHCVHVVLEEEWEHLRFAVRDLDALEATP
jgi:hypothetical protein